MTESILTHKTKVRRGSHPIYPSSPSRRQLLASNLLASLCCCSLLSLSFRCEVFESNSIWLTFRDPIVWLDLYSIVRPVFSETAWIRCSPGFNLLADATDTSRSIIGVLKKYSHSRHSVGLDHREKEENNSMPFTCARTWPSYVMDPQSSGLFRSVGAVNYVKSSHTQWESDMTRLEPTILSQVL